MTQDPVTQRRPRTRPTARWVVASLVLSVLSVFSVGPLGLTGAASAESPVQVAEELAEDGVFVGFGRGAVDETALIAAVEDARFEGLRVVVVLPNDPQPTPAAFARRIQEATEADAALVFPEEGSLETYVVDDLSGSRIRATERARELNDPARAIEVFTEELLAENEASTPPIVGRIINALILLTLAVGAAVGLEQGWARYKRAKTESESGSKPAAKV